MIVAGFSLMAVNDQNELSSRMQSNQQKLYLNNFMENSKLLECHNQRMAAMEKPRSENK